MAHIELKNIKKSFGLVDVIKGVDLEIYSGEFMVFVGPSGCGKSTLLRLLAGLEDITSGEMNFDGNMVNALAPTTSACRPTRVRSRAAICITGSAPRWIATVLQAQEDMRGVAEGLSVKLIAATYGLTRSILEESFLVRMVMGGATSAVTTNSPDFRRRSNSEAGSMYIGG